MAEARHIPDSTDNPHWVHNLEQAVDSCTLHASNPEADILGNVDMVDTQLEKVALPRDVRRGSQIHVRDRTFGDQHVYLARHRWQDD